MCKNLSDRGILTVVTTIALIVGVVAIIVINHIQDVQSQEWEDKIGMEVSVDE